MQAADAVAAWKEKMAEMNDSAGANVQTVNIKYLISENIKLLNHFTLKYQPLYFNSFNAIKEYPSQ